MKKIAQTLFVQKKEKILYYQLTIKNVKNINVRVKPDGNIYVSANNATVQNEIDRFLLSQMENLLKAQKKFKDIPQSDTQLKEYVNGESFYLLGKHSRLRVVQSSSEGVIWDGLYIILSMKDPANYEQKKKLINKFLKDQCQTIFEEILTETYKIFEKYGVEYPRLKIRIMKTRWGSCIPQKNTINLNMQLLEVPRNCIEYVVLHEYCHLIHPNHSKEFYAFQSMLMPDWKERKKLLEATQIFNY